jgi:hypothetical protein
VLRKKDSDQLSLDLPPSASRASRRSKTLTPEKKKGKVESPARIYHLEDAHRRRERIEESKHIREIIDRVRDYK